MNLALSKKWPKWLAILALAAVVILAISGKILMELEWTAMDPDPAHIANLRRDAAVGNAYQPLNEPCMMQATTIDLDLMLEGPFPIGTGREIVMEVSISSDILLSPRVYVGPPVRQLVLRGLPACVADARVVPGVADDIAYGYVTVTFSDLAGAQYMNFGGQDPFAVFAWRHMRVDWSVVPWWIAKTQTPSRIMVTPL